MARWRGYRAGATPFGTDLADPQPDPSAGLRVPQSVRRLSRNSWRDRLRPLRSRRRRYARDLARAGTLLPRDARRERLSPRARAVRPAQARGGEDQEQFPLALFLCAVRPCGIGQVSVAIADPVGARGWGGGGNGLARDRAGSAARWASLAAAGDDHGVRDVRRDAVICGVDRRAGADACRAQPRRAA